MSRTSTDQLTAALLRAIRGVDYAAGGDGFRDDAAAIVDEGLRALLAAGITVDQICKDTQFDRDSIVSLADQEEQRQRLAQQGPSATADNAPRVFLEAYASTEFGDGPRYATVHADADLVGQLLRLQFQCKQFGLSEARKRYACDWGPDDIEEKLRLQSPELVVADDQFWFTSLPKHEDYHVETRALPIAEFVRRISEPASDQPITFGDLSDEEWQEHLSEFASNAAEAALGDPLVAVAIPTAPEFGARWLITQNLTDRWGVINDADRANKPLSELQSTPGLLDRLRGQMVDEVTFISRKDGVFGVLFEVEYVSIESDSDDSSAVLPYDDVVGRLLERAQVLSREFPQVEFAVPHQREVYNGRPAIWGFAPDGALSAEQRSALGNKLLNFAFGPAPDHEMEEEGGMRP